MKTGKLLAVALSAFAALSILAGCAGGSDGGTEDRTPPAAEYTVDESLIAETDANDERFFAKNVERADSPLAGKTIYWLGSSVTYGAQSGGESMADFLAAKTGCICKKDAVSGTTIFCDNKTADTGEKSYTSRLKNSTVFDKTEKVDAFICQISTNDVWGSRKQNLGAIAGADKLQQEDFDLTTTLGGIEFIIAYVVDTWNCPVYFYSGAEFFDTGASSPRTSGNPTGTDYGMLVDKVREVADKWNGVDEIDVQVIDLFHDEAFNAAASDPYYSWAMGDAIHPKRAGYLQWWMPYFEQFLLVALDLY